MEQHGQMKINMKLEGIGKQQRARKIRIDRSMHGNEGVLPLLSPQKNRKMISPSIALPTLLSNCRHSVADYQRDRGLFWQAEGYPAMTTDHSNIAIRAIKAYPDLEVANQCLHQLDQLSLQSFTLNLSNLDLGSGVSPYCIPVLDPASRRIVFARKTKKKIAKLKNSSSIKSASVVVQKDATVKHSAQLHCGEPSRMYRKQLRSLCIVTFKYLGKLVSLDGEVDPRDEISVCQQHCGGENLCIYNGKLLPGNKFTVISQRHQGYPFSLTFYLNGMTADRLSACCEYKHRTGKKLGAKTSHFGFVKIEGAQPCYKCTVSQEHLNCKSSKSNYNLRQNAYASLHSISPSVSKSAPEGELRTSIDQYNSSFESSIEDSPVCSNTSSIGGENEEPLKDAEKNLRKLTVKDSTFTKIQSANYHDKR